jgi:hypothetical protein
MKAGWSLVPVCHQHESCPARRRCPARSKTALATDSARGRCSTPTSQANHKITDAQAL